MTKTPTATTKKMKNVCLIVLGPHRSGTSALTGVLSKLGADLPERLMAATDANPEGYFESKEVMRFNDRLLAEMGSSWHDIAPLNIDALPDQVKEGYLGEAVEVLRGEFSNARIPLLKDPRICRLVGFWSEAFERINYTPVFIHTHRNPLETAQSLKRRDGFPIEVGLLIWLRHIIDAEAATRDSARVFINYQDLLDDWRTEISRIEAATGFAFYRNTPAVRREIESFLQVGLRHQTRTDADVYRSTQVADVVRDTFRIIEGWETDVSGKNNLERLDQLRNRFDGAMEQVGTFVQALANTRTEFLQEKKTLEQASEKLKEEKAVIAAELERIRKESADKDAAKAQKIAELEQATGRINDEKARIAAELEHIRKESADRDAAKAQKIAELEQSSAYLSGEKAQLVSELGRTRSELAEKDIESRSKISSLEQNAAKLAQSKDQLESELEALRDSAAEQRSQLEGELRQRSLEAEEWFMANKRLEAEKAEIEAEAEDVQDKLQASLRERDNSIRALESGMQSRFDETANLSTLLLDAETRLHEEQARHKCRLGELEAALKQRSAEAANRSEDNLRLAQTLERLEAEAEEVQNKLQASLHERDNNIRVLEGNVQSRFDEVAQISKMLIEAEERLLSERMEYSTRLAQETEQNGLLRQELEEVRKNALKEHEKVTALLSSNSWRLTGPLRRFVMLFRR